MRPRGRPPMPRATSSAIEPVGITSTGTRVSSPSRMIEPLPNCRSIWRSAASSALPLSPIRSGIAVLPLGAMGTPYCLSASVRLAATFGALHLKYQHSTYSHLKYCARGQHRTRYASPPTFPGHGHSWVTNFPDHSGLGRRSTSRTRGAPTFITIGERLFDRGQDAPARSIDRGALHQAADGRPTMIRALIDGSGPRETPGEQWET